MIIVPLNRRFKKLSMYQAAATAWRRLASIFESPKKITSGIASLIEFDRSLKGLSLEDRNHVRTCNWFLRQIETRQENFETSKLIIKGVSFIGEGEKRKLLKVDARAYYKNPDQKDASYHVGFLPDAGTLLVVFRVAAEKATKPEKNNANSFQDFHVLLIEQPRWGANAPNALEPLGGLLTEHEKVDLASIRKGILREALEEGGKPLQDIFARCLSVEQVSLGTPVSTHTGYTDKQYQSYVVIDLTAEALRSTKESLVGQFGGIEAEGERTKPVILPFIEAWNALLDRGENTYGSVMMGRFVKNFPDRPTQRHEQEIWPLAA